MRKYLMLVAIISCAGVWQARQAQAGNGELSSPTVTTVVRYCEDYGTRARCEDDPSQVGAKRTVNGVTDYYCTWAKNCSWDTIWPGGFSSSKQVCQATPTNSTVNCGSFTTQDGCVNNSGGRCLTPSSK